MIKVNVMYPYTEGARFDHTYYRDRHMPMVKARLGSACNYYTVEKGLAGGAPGAPPAFVAMCAFICDSVEGFQAAMQEHGAQVLVRGGEFEVLEGSWTPSRLIVLGFQDRAAAKAFYDSQTYQDAKSLRLDAGVMRMVVVDGVS